MQNTENTNIFDIIEITGLDNFKFLQSQVTADLTELESKSDSESNQSSNKKNYILASYCNRKGRVIAVFYILKQNSNYIFITLGNTGALLIKKLKKYSLFSKIDFKLISNQEQNTRDKNNPDEISVTQKLNSIKSEHNLNLDIEYLINNLIPIITPENSEKFLPDNLNLLSLGAVSLKKGCFLGQEIIARVFYKGKTKKVLSNNIINHKELDQNADILYKYNNLILFVSDL